MIKIIIIYLRYFNTYKRFPYSFGEGMLRNHMASGPCGCAKLVNTPRSLLKA